MALSEHYRRQAGLMVRVLPFVAEETCFALKGGTAINLFVRDLPRLSVDIDLTYVPVADRAESLADISAAMGRIAGRVSAGLPGSHVHATTLRGDGTVRKLIAALDRQHPRDLFDVQDLLADEGIDEKLRNAFLVYLLSHNRPMAEVLAPTRRDISQEFERGFSGMTERAVTVDELTEVRERLVADIVGNMPQAHRDLLISFKAGEPDWSLLDVPDAEALPAVRWRMANLAKLDSERRAGLLDKLRAALDAALPESR